MQTLRNNPVRKICLFLGTAFAAACADSPVPDGQPQAPTEIRFDAGIEAPVITRARIAGTSFPNNSSYGLFVCRHEDGVPTIFQNSTAGNNNMRALVEVIAAPPTTTWRYSYSNMLNTSFETVYINDKDYTTDFYAYAPWITGVTRPDQIPYVFTQQYDLMYATQNGTSNRGVFSDGTTKTVSFTFRHALACLRFELKKKYSGDVVGIGYARLRKTANAGAQTNLYSTGTFNAMDGTFSGLNAVNELTYDFADFNIPDNPAYGAFETLVVPSQDIDDKGLEVQFYSNVTSETMKLTIGRDHTKYYDDALGDYCYGFRAGKIYTFRITLDNYLKLDNVTVTDSWTVEETKDIKI